MNQTIKKATVQQYHYDNHEQLQQHLDNFVSACNFSQRLKTLKGLPPENLSVNAGPPSHNGSLSTRTSKPQV